jgi:integrase
MGKDYIEKLDLKKLSSDIIPLRFRLIYNTLFYSGMRPGEVLKLKPTDFHKEYREDKDKNYYFIDMATQKNKTKNELTPIRQVDYTGIMDFVRLQTIGSSDFIFGSPRNKFQKQMSVSWLNRELKKHMSLVGITKDLSAHSFRAGLVTYLREEKGLTYAEIATITRHQNLRIMQKHYDKRIKHNAYDIIEQI